MSQTIKQFAISQGISTQAVDKMLKKYSKELTGHIDRTCRPALLDDYAINFLSNQRKAIQVVQISSDERFQQLRDENEKLKSAFIQLQQDYIRKTELLAEANLEVNNLHYQIEMKAIETEKEVESRYSKTFFGLYKKIR